MCRGTFRADAFGQQRGLRGQAWQSNLLARYGRIPFLVTPEREVAKLRRYCLSSLPPGQVNWSRSGSKKKSARLKVPSLRALRSRIVMCGAIFCRISQARNAPVPQALSAASRWGFRPRRSRVRSSIPW
jgi:hypothetical protein